MTAKGVNAHSLPTRRLWASPFVPARAASVFELWWLALVAFCKAVACCVCYGKTRDCKRLLANYLPGGQVKEHETQGHPPAMHGLAYRAHGLAFQAQSPVYTKNGKSCHLRDMWPTTFTPKFRFCAQLKTPETHYLDI